MAVFTSRRTAAVVAVVAILFGVFFGCYRSVSAQRSKVLEAHFSVVAEAVDACADTAANLGTVAQHYLGAQAKEVTALASALTAVRQAGESDALLPAYHALTAAADSTAFALEGQPLSEKDAQYVRSFQAELEGRAFTVAHSPYRDQALAFNQVLLERFPVNLLRRVLPLRPLEV